MGSPLNVIQLSGNRQIILFDLTLGITEFNEMSVIAGASRQSRQNLRDGKCDAKIHPDRWGKYGKGTRAYG